MSVLSDEQKWQLWDEVSHPSACLNAIILAYGNAVADAAIAADRAARAEPVAIYEHKQRRDSFPVWVPGVTVLKYIPQGTKLYTAPPDAPVVPECPFPCGWRKLHELMVKDAAWVSRELQAYPDEPLPEHLPQIVFVNHDRALRVVRAMLAAAPAPSQDNEGAA